MNPWYRRILTAMTGCSSIFAWDGDDNSEVDAAIQRIGSSGQPGTAPRPRRPI